MDNMIRTPETVLSVDVYWTLQVVSWQRTSTGSSPNTYKYTGSPELSDNTQGQFFHPEICNSLSPTLSELEKLCLVCHDGFFMTILFLRLQCANFNL